MKIADAKQQFIQDWGIMAGSWGIHRTMGQIHAFLLVNDTAQSTDDIMKGLSISRGNANMTVRELLQWGLISKTTVAGDRKEFFQAEKDMWKVAQLIAKERRRRELEPMVAALAKFGKIEGPKEDIREFQELIGSIRTVSEIASKALDFLGKSGTVGLLRIFK